MRRTVVLALVLVGACADAAYGATDAQLLQRHKPVVVLHPEERFRPVRVDAFLGDARLEQRLSDDTWSPALFAGGLPESDPPSCIRKPCWRLDLPGCTAATGVTTVDCYAAADRLRPSAPVVYGAVLRRSNRIVLEYWYWYSYNFWSGDHPPSSRVWQAHEGDWEAVVVVLTRAGKPLLAAYSRHSCGKRRAWARVPKARRTHPVVYVALGSHAHYFRAGDQPIDLREQCYDPVGAALLRSALPQVLDRVGNGPRVATRLVRVSASSPAWMRFPGAWGEPSWFYPGGARVYEYAPGGPTGPGFHDVWIDPLATIARWPAG